ncbi:MAG: hypothetical protein RPU51_09835 [Candidatus Sedimenticola sp. (ex Thyasira tokunagai)]
MQIKVKGSRVQLLRSIYLPEKKRSTQKMVAGFPTGNTSIPAHVREHLTDEEAAQVEGWLTDQQDKEKAHSRSMAVNHAHYTVDRITEALEAGQVVSDEQVEKVRASIKSLQGALRKAVKNNKKAAEEAAKKNETETDSE